MITYTAAPADLPPAGLPGLDPAWSRLVPVTDADGVERTFHVLDNGVTDPVGTLLCVHGNPTWSYLWRGLLAAAPAGWRVVAPDHLGMGHSERLDSARTLAQRVDDLGRLTDALGVTGPVVTVAHDWGGILSMGWAHRHRDQLRGIVLTNTAVSQPPTGKGPVLIRAAHVPLIGENACVRTPTFVRGTTSLTWPLLDKEVRDAFAEPYGTPARRAAVGGFVADIPFAAGHPSRPALDELNEGMRTLDVPALLLWGPRDPVFLEEHLRDIRDRLPQARTHRYPRASHLLPEDAPEYAEAVVDFVASLDEPAREVAATQDRPQLWAQLDAHSHDDTPAVVEVGGASISWAQLHGKVTDLAGALVAGGVQPGDRVALLVPPSIDLTVAVYAVWRAGGVIVVADKGLGLRGMGGALRSARVDHVIGATQGIVAAKAMRVPGTRFPVRSFGTLMAGPKGPLPEVSADMEAAVLFTSGATGPAKGVLYRHRQARAQVELVRSTYGLTSGDRFVAAFAPFAIFGPALGIASAVPDVDVTRPGTLTAAALADAAAAVDATVVFASPAALRNVLSTVDGLDAAGLGALGTVRLLMSAGAPVPAALLRELAATMPMASMHTPYGMTEVLPVTDVTLAEIEAAGAGEGVCVGRPLPGVEVALSPLSPLGLADGELTTDAGVTGEICVRAEHVKDRYDALWMTERAASRNPGWHRTGDVGHLDEDGRLWVQGRTVHVLTTVDGVVTPVGVEQRVETLGSSAAVVGVGPVGTQQVVVVVTGTGEVLASAALTEAVRGVAGVPVSAVLVRKDLPVDIRHNSKVDRVAVAQWASGVLAGGRA
ncbi:alpha/beta fold hydrolase [Rhodococcus antarcticus]|uniref:Alpha/beta fold hydrolase n=1 Tax=Rhodococcus antarcticus TaxID=2987751 RepID=A0ABY6NXJ6_9NOCA|nr:alpha/beta fold hydrolase [Rhodococcus antarcticus]UZJ24117.1 alpha/beta fold hydrolase [Rhodococcus antarcticus]